MTVRLAASALLARSFFAAASRRSSTVAARACPAGPFAAISPCFSFAPCALTLNQPLLSVGFYPLILPSHYPLFSLPLLSFSLLYSLHYCSSLFPSSSFLFFFLFFF